MLAPCCRVGQDIRGVQLTGWIPPSVLRTVLPGYKIQNGSDVRVVTTETADDDHLGYDKVNLMISICPTREEYLRTPYGQKYGERQSPKIAAAFLAHLKQRPRRGLFGVCDAHPLQTPDPSFLETALATRGARFVHGGEYHAPYLRRRAMRGDWGITSPSTTAFYSMFDNPRPVKGASYHVFFCGEPNRILPQWADVWVDCKLISGSPAIYEPFWLTSMAERVNHTVDDINAPRGDAIGGKPRFCAFLYSNCVPWREALFYALSRYSPVDALGKSPRRVTRGKSDAGRTSASFMDDAVDMYRPYRFVICCENSRINGYITEKVVNARLAGCVPIYLGAPDWDKYINPAAVIDASSPNFEAVVKAVDSDPELRVRMLSEPLIRPEILVKYTQ